MEHKPNSIFEAANVILEALDSSSDFKKMLAKMQTDAKKVEVQMDGMVFETPSYLSISYRGNMGASVERNVNPALKMKGMPTIEELKKKFTEWAETGSPDYSWSIIFKKPTAGLLFLKEIVKFDAVIASITSDLSSKSKEIFNAWAEQNKIVVSLASSKAKYNDAEKLLDAIANKFK